MIDDTIGLGKGLGNDKNILENYEAVLKNTEIQETINYILEELKKHGSDWIMGIQEAMKNEIEYVVGSKKIDKSLVQNSIGPFIGVGAVVLIILIVWFISEAKDNPPGNRDWDVREAGDWGKALLLFAAAVGIGGSVINGLINNVPQVIEIAKDINDPDSVMLEGDVPLDNPDHIPNYSYDNTNKKTYNTTTTNNVDQTTGVNTNTTTQVQKYNWPSYLKLDFETVELLLDIDPKLFEGYDSTDWNLTINKIDIPWSHTELLYHINKQEKSVQKTIFTAYAYRLGLDQTKINQIDRNKLPILIMDDIQKIAFDERYNPYGF